MRRARGVVISLLLAGCIGKAPLAVGGGAVVIHTVDEENALPGTPGWLTWTAANGEMEAYASTTSLRGGDVLSVHASARPDPVLASWTVTRLGWYRHVGGRVVASGDGVHVSPQPMPDPDPSTGRIECAWPEVLSLSIDPAWTPGVYLLQLYAASGDAAEVPFVVREPQPRAPVLVVLPINTWQAYNDWGGNSLYVNSTTFPAARAWEVSYDRPYVAAEDLLIRDRYFVEFVESQGWDTAWVTDVDLDLDPTLAVGRRLIMLTGHDEYVSARERGALEDAVSSGASLASFSGDEIFWQVRIASSSSGAPGRTIVCYKDDVVSDPLYATQPQLATTMWRLPPVSRPEDQLLGNQSSAWHDAYLPLVIAAPEHWLLAGTGLTQGDLVPGVFGYESDHTFSDSPPLVTVGKIPVLTHDGLLDRADVVARDTSQGGFVVGGGSIDWAAVLAMDHVWDLRAQQIVGNVVSRALGQSFTPVRAAPLGPPAASPSYVASTVSTVFAGSPLVAPAGVTVLADRIYVADPGAHAIVRILAGTAQVVVSGLPSPLSLTTGSDGNIYWVDGKDGGLYRLASDGSVGNLASLGTPLGICAGSDGGLYVADEGASALVRVALDGSMTTVSQPGDLAAVTTVGCDPNGVIYALDAAHGRLVPFDPTLGAGPALVDDTYSRGVLDGPLGQAMLGGGRGLAARNGRLVFSEAANASVRQLWNGELRTLAGGATARLVDGAGAKAGFGMPAGIVATDDGSFLVADTGNAAVRRILPANAGQARQPPVTGVQASKKIARPWP
jgi:hypothetical protein